MNSIKIRGIGGRRGIAVLAFLLAVGVASVWATSTAATQEQHHVGYLEVHNNTGHSVTVSYQGHEGHWSELGHVQSQHSNTFKLPSCGRQFHFRANDSEHGVWTTERHCECEHTASWTVGSH